MYAFSKKIEFSTPAVSGRALARALCKGRAAIHKYCVGLSAIFKILSLTQYSIYVKTQPSSL
jgi:hypothetical protein